MKIKLLHMFWAAGLVMAVITACTKSDFAENANSTMDTLRVDIGAEPPSLDPTLSEDTSSERVLFDLFAGLVDFDQANNVIPGMAYKWQISPDGKTYTFYLRKGLKFSDGSPISAQDFVYSWQRLVDPAIASPYNFLLANLVNAKAIIAGKANPTSLGILAPNPHIVVVKLTYANPVFIKSLVLPNLAVVSRKCIEKYADNWTKPQNIVTSGAYTLQDHVVNGYMLAVKNPNYYAAKQVNIAKVKYFPYIDTSAAVSSYKAGGLDITWQNVPVDQYKQLKQAYPRELHTVRQEALYYYDLNASLPELANNPKLRQALAMAIDREILVKRVLGGQQSAVYAMATPTIEAGNYAKVKYNWAAWPRARQIEEALKLYTAAGYKPNHPLQISIAYNTNDMHKKIALAVAAMWEKVLGVQVNIKNQEWKTFLQARHEGNYAVARDGWVADYNSVTTYTQLYQCNSPQNNSHYCNSNYDKLLAKAMIEPNPAKRKKLYQQALAIPLNDYAVIPLFQYTYTKLVKPYVQNYKVEINYLDHVQSKWLRMKNY
jgi:oligopeptide transport system substrate-binding protein